MSNSYLLLFLLATTFSLISCGSGEQSADLQTEAEVKPAPGMTTEHFNQLLNNVTNIEYIFIDYPISFSQSETNAVRQAVMFIDRETAVPDPACDATAMVIFMGGGEILAEGNIYFTGECAYFVFEKNREPAYFHRLTATGHQFYNSVLTNYFNQLQQQQRQQ